MKKFLICFILFPINLYAIDFSSVINQQNRVIQNQERIEREKILQQELRNIEFERKQAIARAARKKSLQEGFEDDGKIIQNLSNIQCFRIKQINFSKNNILSKREEKNLTAKYLGKCLILEQIEYFTKEITNYLLQKDFVTSQAFLPKQDISSGNLEIEIFEGQLEDLVLNEDGFFDKTQKFSAFGLINKGEALNLRDVAIGLDSMNRLSSNAANVKIFAGSKQNSSIIFIENKSQNKLRLSFSVDDNGSEITGKKRDVIGVSYDNLLHLNDNFNFSRAANDFDKKSGERKGHFVGYNYSIPFKRHLLTLGYSKYSYSFFTGDIVKTRSSGASTTRNAMLDSVLIKRDKYKITTNLQLQNRNNANFTGDLKNQTSSRKATNGSVGISNILFFEDASLLLRPSYIKGLELLDAKKDDEDVKKNEVHGQFEAFKFYANYSHNLHIPLMQIPFNYNLNFDSQIAKQALYSNDQIFAGGAFSVRGFENGSISGDSGYVVRNDLKFNLGKIFNAKKLPSIIHNFSITPFYDYGYVISKANGSSGRLSGSGLKFDFIGKNLSASLTYAWVASKSQLLQQDYNENQALYFNVASEFGFF